MQAVSTLRSILFPAAVAGLVLAGNLFGEAPVHKTFSLEGNLADTVIYEKDAYKKGRTGDFADAALSDSVLQSLWLFVQKAAEDSLALSARDTIRVPDSLRETDPFRYKYYVALLDSLTHQIVRDSLLQKVKEWRAASDTLRARADSADRFRLDSLYSRDSAARARAAFLAWYNGLSKEERRKYDYEQKMNRKMHEMDSLKSLKEEQKAVRDSIRESTPRILESFAVPDSLKYKRIVSWHLDPDFHNMGTHVPDTSYNYYFYDYAFRRQDVNATWLGVAGSPVQNYNFLGRRSYSGVDFYTPYESWSYSHGTFPHFNTKTPYTELAYWGTLLLASDETESDNLHILTTQNITPELNLQLLYDRWGGGGMLDNEETKNKTFALAGNYLGKNYLAHAGIISNTVSHEENGGVQDAKWVRDTTVDAREISVVLNNASSKLKKRTAFLDQQYRIPLDFVRDLIAPGDTTAEADSDEDATTAFVGHSTEWNWYNRNYQDKFSSTNTYIADLFHGINNYSPSESNDYFRVTELDNKLFVRLQPWKDDAIVSKLNVGIGDKYRTYYDSYDSLKTSSVQKENSVYAYAGVEGNLHQYFDWDAKGRFTFAGAELGDFDINASARVNFFPFRRARKSPLSLGVRFGTSLTEPNHYQQRIYANHYSWNNTFGKTSQSSLRATVDIPYWKLHADAGYSLVGNHIYYDTTAVIRQNSGVVSVLSASLRKEFVIGGLLHLDNKVLAQVSSDQEILPLPALALNLKWFAQFAVQKDAERNNVMVMQIGLNGWYNTQWYAPAWNPAAGVFHNQARALYENGPVVDVFMNIQWKRACIFLKYENANMGWPLKDSDYFTAHNYIGTQRTLKLGIFWPFYVQPGKRGSSSSRGFSTEGSLDSAARPGGSGSVNSRAQTARNR